MAYAMALLKWSGPLLPAAKSGECMAQPHWTQWLPSNPIHDIRSQSLSFEDACRSMTNEAFFQVCSLSRAMVIWIRQEGAVIQSPSERCNTHVPGGYRAGASFY
jgi:hypothetical protein